MSGNSSKTIELRISEEYKILMNCDISSTNGTHKTEKIDKGLGKGMD
jgi:hypothetical protein